MAYLLGLEARQSYMLNDRKPILLSREFGNKNKILKKKVGEAPASSPAVNYVLDFECCCSVRQSI